MDPQTSQFVQAFIVIILFVAISVLIGSLIWEVPEDEIMPRVKPSARRFFLKVKRFFRI